MGVIVIIRLSGCLTIMHHDTIVRTALSLLSSWKGRTGQEDCEL